MTILIKEKYDASFIRYLINYIRDYVVKHIDEKQLARWNEYFDANNIKIDGNLVLLTAINNLIYLNYLNGWVIKINPNIKLYNYNIEQLCNLITYGNLDVEPYPILRETFESVNDNINQIYDDYINGGY